MIKLFLWNPMRLGLKIFVLLWAAMLFNNIADAHVEHPKDLSNIGIDEKLGQVIPLDLIFHDEHGHSISLKQLIHRPTILAPVYYHCPNVCSFLLFNLAEVINKMPSEAGKEYQVLTFSFDETEDSNLALEKKRMYLKMIEKSFPEDAWRFLTGDKENIRQLTDAIGFHFKRQGQDFLHPVSLVILSPNGKITRYLYGTEFLPFDLKMALLEASEGRVGPTLSKVLRFCFSYDPQGRKYVFNTLKVTGIVTLLFALSLILFIVFKGKKKSMKEESSR
jgi:protein SCO1/2